MTTGYSSYLQAIFDNERVWIYGWGGGFFSGSCPHTTAPLSARVSLERGEIRVVSAALSQITPAVCVNIGRSLLT